MREDETLKQRREWRLGDTALLLAGCLVALVIAELGLRVFGYSRPTFYSLDPDRGWELGKNLSGLWDSEGRSVFTTNSDGLHDREHRKAKPPNTIRIAVLGDCMTEPRQIPIEQNFCSVTERLLRSCPAVHGRQVEVINFAVAGYGTSEELLTLRDQVWAYEPDVVVLAFYTGNDVGENFPRYPHSSYDISSLYPLFRLRDGHLVLDNSFRNYATWKTRLLIFLSEHCRLFQLINEARRSYDGTRLELMYLIKRSGTDGFRRLSSMPLPEPLRIPRPDGDKCISPPFMDARDYLAPTDAHWNDAWAVTEELVRTVNREVKQHGTTFLLVTLVNAAQVYPDPQYRKEYMRRCGVTDLFYPERRLKVLAQRERFAMLNTAEPLQAYADERREFLHGFYNSARKGTGHINALGHRLIGQLIAGELCRTARRPPVSTSSRSEPKKLISY